WVGELEGGGLEPAGGRKLVRVEGHVRAHEGGRVHERHVGTQADRDRQLRAELLGAFEGGAQVTAGVELDGGCVRTDELEAVIGGVVHAGQRIFDDHHAGGDEGPGVA